MPESDRAVARFADRFDVLAETLDRVASGGGEGQGGETESEEDLANHGSVLGKGFRISVLGTKRSASLRVPPGGAPATAMQVACSGPYRATMKVPDPILFASDAELLAFAGVTMLVFAGLASLMERRRTRRAALNRVGWVPWTGIFLTLAIVGGGLLAVAVPAMLKA